MIETSEPPRMSEGARWHRCALQVNPFAYLAANAKQIAGLDDEDAYNEAMVHALVEAGVEAIAITDHWRVDTSESLGAAAQAAGISVFPGFEATSKDGVHLLVIYDPSTEAANINRNIGECGIPADCEDSRPGNKDALELLECAERWGAVVVAAHVTSGGGLFDKLSGQSAISVWKDPRLHAAAYGGTNPTQAHSMILANKDPMYQRANPLAVLQAADVSKPEDVAKSGSTTWIKLSSFSLSGLDLAFRTPDTRVRLEDPSLTPHPVIRSVHWEGGFLDGVSLRFNDSLNVFIGGRGSGKSTVIESLRHVLDLEPLGVVSKAEHTAMVNGVLGSGTKTVLELETQTPRRERFTIERLVGSSPVVRSVDGSVLRSTPSDVLPGARVFGQRELAELARDKVGLTALLSGFLPPDSEAVPNGAVEKLHRELRSSREGILACKTDLADLDDKASRRMVQEERLSRFTAAGVGEKLRLQEEEQREDGALRQVETLLAAVVDLTSLTLTSDQLAEALSANLPRQEILQRANAVLVAYNKAVTDAAGRLADAREQAIAQLAQLRNEWTGATSEIRDGLDRVLRELQPDGIDGDEYLRLTAALAGTANVPELQAKKREELEHLQETRLALLIELEDARAARLRRLQSEAKRVSRSMKGVLRANVRDGEDRSELIQVFSGTGKRLDRVKSAIENAPTLSPRAFVEVCRQGQDAIVQTYPAITPMQAGFLASAPDDMLLRAEEVEFPMSTDLELNVGTSEEPIWRSLDNLSTGQKATALLLLLMSRGDGPLIIDQPEDDLDNRFIFDEIVPRLRDTKGKRQVIVSSHNANIPVLGDAEQIIALAAEDVGSGLHGSVATGACGSIDRPAVQALVEELLEGGREAFNTRRYLYGF